MTPADDHGLTTALQRAHWEAHITPKPATPMHDCRLCIYILIILLAVCVAASVIEFLAAYGVLK
jgi:hypothetical protein